MQTRSTIAVSVLLGLIAAQAVAGPDDLPRLLRAHEYAQAEAAADARLAHDPRDAGALAAKSGAIAAAGPAARYDEAIRLAEQCVAAHPRLSACYLALGNALGASARQASPMTAMGYATRLKDAFLRAVELDPRNTDARFALLDYYLQAPALVGGGKGRARALAEQTEAVDPAAARLMQAQIALSAGAPGKAEAIALEVNPEDNAMLADRQRDLLIALGHRYQADGRHADSERIAQIVRQRFSGPH